MDFDDKTKIAWPNHLSAEYQLRRLSEWWDKEHQLGGLPYPIMTTLITFPHATRGALRERSQGWKWWMPNVLFALSRGGYGCLFLYVRGKGQSCALRADEVEVKAQLEMAGNLVFMVATAQEAREIICDYVAGKYVREVGE